MKYYNLDQEEQDIIRAFESDRLSPVPDLAKTKRLMRQYAKNTLNKSRNINIRLPEKTLLKLKQRAVSEGIPYQTLVSSVLHKFANS